MARVVYNRRGKKVILLNPSEKSQKAAAELKSGVHLTNTGAVKRSKNGKVKKLNDTQKAYRSGYLKARKDNAKAWKSKRNKSYGIITIK